MKSKCLLFLCLTFSTFHLSVFYNEARASMINFDSLEPGINAGNVLAGSGVTFTSGLIPNELPDNGEITLSSPVSQFVIINNENAISPPNFATGTAGNIDLLMSFAIPVTSVALTSDDDANESEDIIRLLALAPTGNPYEFTVLAIDEAYDSAVSPPDNLLSVSLGGAESFGYALFQTTTGPEGFDDLTFTPVPIPSTLLLLGSGLSAAFAFRRKRLLRKM